MNRKEKSETDGMRRNGEERCCVRQLRRIWLGLFLMLAVMACRPDKVLANPTIAKIGACSRGYDITGDGRADRITITATARDRYGNPVGRTVKVNGRTALRVPDYVGYGFDAQIITLNRSVPFLYLRIWGDNGPDSCGIYRYSRGRLRNVFDFMTFYKYGSHQDGHIRKVSGNKIYIAQDAMSWAFGSLSLRFTLVYRGGTLRLASRYGDVAWIAGTGVSAYKPLRYTTKLYRTAASGRVSRTLAKGTRVRIEKVYMGQNSVRFYIRTRNGKGGWYVSPKKHRYGMRPLLIGQFYAG